MFIFDHEEDGTAFKVVLDASFALISRRQAIPGGKAEEDSLSKLAEYFSLLVSLFLVCKCIHVASNSSAVPLYR